MTRSTTPEIDTVMSVVTVPAAKEKPTTTEAETRECRDDTAELPADPQSAAETRDDGDAAPLRRGIPWARLLAYGVLPAMALLLALGAGYLKWLDSSARDTQQAGIESVRTATDSTIAMLSYKPDTVERDLDAARDRLTGPFRDDYSSLIHDVVAPGAKQKQISAVASVPAAASVSATEKHAVVLVFINQATTIGTDPPTNTASSVRVTLDKISGQWLIAGFDPV